MEKIIKPLKKRLIMTLCSVFLMITIVPMSSAFDAPNSPPVAELGGPYIGYEGVPVLFDASASWDPDFDPLFYNWDFDGDGLPDADRFWYDSPYINNTWYDDYTGYVTVFVADSTTFSYFDTDTALVTILNQDPEIISIDGLPSDPIPMGSTIQFTCTFIDPGTFDTHTGVIDWDDISYNTFPITGYSFTVQHTYTDPGVYAVNIMVVDDDGGSDTEVVYIVIYDPDSDGFVTGGGWIISPEGAYKPDPTLTGKATFGFVSKYKKGQNTPSGNTEFQFHAAGMNFHSSIYDWLIVAGPKAMFKGSGTINGAGDYGFMLTAIDGALTEGGLDRFRIKIWDKGTDVIIYDNMVGEEETVLEAGQIIIHKK